MADGAPSPQLTGVVIITLPPPDNPCLGKTITAYTLSDSDHHQPSTSQPTHQIDDPQPAHRSSSSFRNFILNTPTAVLLSTLGLSLIAVYVWISISQENFFQLRDDFQDPQKNKSQGQQHTFVFPLYQKPYSELGDIELKLGRLVDSIAFNDTISEPKLASTASKTDAAGVIPVSGNIHPQGVYYTYLHFGNPPRPYFLDMDTGSDLTWIQCDAPCTSCAKGAHPLYKPEKANIIPLKDSYCLEIQRNQLTKDCSSCHQCDYEIEYADHSSSMGVLARDEIFLNIANGSLTKSKVVFGCAYDQQGLLLNTLGRTDGILGLSKGKIGLTSQLASQGVIKNVVGHCLSTETSGGGYMFLGDDFVPHWKMAWVPMLQSHDTNSYQAEVVNVNYGSRHTGFRNVESGQSRIVFDSGSSYSYFTDEAYNNLVTILNDISSENLVPDNMDTSFPVCWKAKSILSCCAGYLENWTVIGFLLWKLWICCRLMLGDLLARDICQRSGTIIQTSEPSVSKQVVGCAHKTSNTS
ncbi:hypothetical protein ACS0TY_031318 [Phlomoides rotata]